MTTKDTNPKDAVGTAKWRQFCTVPLPPLWEVGVAMLEGARKYGRHNYRAAGVRASVYIDAAMGHLGQWWEGEDIDKDSGLSHITKAIATLFVMRDAMLMDGMFTDDRPPKIQLDKIRTELQAKVEEIMAQYPDAVDPVTQESAEVKHWEGASEKANYDDEPVGVPSWLAPPENGVPEHYVLNPKNNRVYRVVPGARFESLRTGTKLRLTSVKHSLQPCTKEGVVL